MKLVSGLPVALEAEQRAMVGELKLKRIMLVLEVHGKERD
jgi:hypothetical protein